MLGASLLHVCLAASLPLWVRVTNAPEASPAFLHVFVRHSSKPYYQHANIGTNGLRDGAVPQGGHAARIGAGVTTPWTDLAPVLGQRGRNCDRFALSMVRGWGAPVTNASFRLEFSTDGKSVFKAFDRRGRGSGMNLVVLRRSEGATTEILSDAECVADAVRKYRDLPAVAGRFPTRFPMATGFSLNPDLTRPEIYDAEVRMLRGLGINCANGRKGDFPFCRLTAFGLGPFVHADRAATRERASAWRGKQRQSALANAVLVNVGDEPSVPPKHLQTCATCLTNAQTAVSAGSDGGEGFYRSRRRLLDETVESFRTIRESVEAELPNMPVAVNNGISLVYHGNLARTGVDWFKVYGSGALTYGWGEDWANHGRTRQINSIYWDAMRAACEPRCLPFGFYDILEHDPWEVQAKAFSAIGRGARQLYFFNYGPWYAIASDQQSRRPEALDAIRRVTKTVGPVEDEILAAHCARGDAAIFLGMAGDIWTAEADDEFGMERSAMSLLLRHCGVRTDVLGEDGVAAALGRYPLLFVLDRNVRRDVAEAILSWTRKGGRLYLGPNAMSADEFGRAIDLGFARSPYAKEESVGRPQYELVKCRSLAAFEGMDVVVGRCDELWRERSLGAGRVFASGFFPALDYWRSATADGSRHGQLVYPDAHRSFLKSRVLENLPVRCQTDDPLVEMSLLAGSSACVLVFSNWSGAPAKVGFVVRRTGPATVRTTAGAVLSGVRSVRRGEHLDLEGRIALNAGAFVVLEGGR